MSYKIHQSILKISLRDIEENLKEAKIKSIITELLKPQT